MVRDHVCELHGFILHGVDQPDTVDEIGGARAGCFVELGQLLRGHGQVCVEDKQEIACGRGEGFAHGVAFAFAELPERFDISVGIGCGDPLDFVPGVVLGMAFDEDDLGAESHFWCALHGIFDIPGFVPGGDDDRASILLAGWGRWLQARDLNHGQAEWSEERGEPAVEQRSEQGCVDRPENPCICLEAFPACQVEQIANIGGREPVLGKGRGFEVHGLGTIENRPPHVVKKIQNEAGSGVGEGPDSHQQFLDVVQVIHEVGKNDIIESFSGLEFFGGGGVEFEFWVAFPSSIDHRFAEIDADSAGRFEGSEQVAQPATELQNPAALGDEETIEMLEKLVIVTLGFRVAASRALLVERPSIWHAPRGLHQAPS